MLIKKSIYLFLLILFMQGCVERGKSLNIPQESKTIKEKKSTYTEPYYALKVNASDSKNETLKNTISGSLLLIIGLIILL